jgi:arylsulfatase A-like enzyme
MVPWLTGETDEPAPPLFFDYQGQVAIIEGQYKLYKSGEDAPFKLYDLTEDPAEQKDQSGAHPKIKAKMVEAHKPWQASVARSLDGVDYQK